MKALIKFKTHSRSTKSGFTLMEVLTSVMLMSVFTVVALTSMGTVVDDARFNQTLRELEQIRNGLTGETQRLETGLRKNYGYLGDLGKLPTSAQGLAALTSVPSGVSLWSANAPTQMPLYGVVYGWKGPYIFNTAQQDYTTDAWGNAYVYSDYPSPGDDGKLIRSLGADGAVLGTGYAQDIDLIIPESVINGRVLGYVVQPDSSTMGADQAAFTGTATATLHVGDGFGSTSSSTIAVASGKYVFEDVKLGYASLEVNTTIPNIERLGPSIVEVNKASTAALPVAKSPTSIYGNVPMCTEPADIALIPTDYDTGGYDVGDLGVNVFWWNAASKRIRIRIQIPDQSGAPTTLTLASTDFYHENEYSRDAVTHGTAMVLDSFDIILLQDDKDPNLGGEGVLPSFNSPTEQLDFVADQARGNYRLGGGFVRKTSGTAAIPSRTAYVFDDSDGVGAQEITFLENRSYDLVFNYSGGPAWPVSVPTGNPLDAFNFHDPSHFYYRLGCKFFSAQSVVTGDL